MCVRLNRVRFCVKEHTRASNTNICFDTAAASSSFIRFFFFFSYECMLVCECVRSCGTRYTLVSVSMDISTEPMTISVSFDAYVNIRNG